MVSEVLTVRGFDIHGLSLAGPIGTWLDRAKLVQAVLGADFRPFEVFLRLSAHLRFINSDKRLRPAAVRWPLLDLRLDRVLAGLVAVVLPFVALFVVIPPSAAMARSIRSRSFFNSATMTCRFIKRDSSLESLPIKSYQA